MDRLLDKLFAPATRSVETLRPGRRSPPFLRPTSVLPSDHPPRSTRPPGVLDSFKPRGRPPTAFAQWTSFQYSFFINQASHVKTSRNSTTQMPRERRADWLGSLT